MGAFVMASIGLNRFETWIQEQALIGVNIVLICFLLWMLYKRAYIPALIGFIMISIISLFIVAPEKSRDVGAFFGSMFGF